MPTTLLTLPTFTLPERAIELMAWYKSKSANTMPAFADGYIALISNHPGGEPRLPTFDHNWYEATGVRIDAEARLQRITVSAPETWRQRLQRNRLHLIPTEFCNRYTLYPGSDTEIVCHRLDQESFEVTVRIPFGETFPAPLATVWPYARELTEDAVAVFV